MSRRPCGSPPTRVGNARRSARRQSAGAALRLSHRVLREPRRTWGWRDGRPAQLRAVQRSRQPWLEAGAARVREEAGGVNAVPDCVACNRERLNRAGVARGRPTSDDASV